MAGCRARAKRTADTGAACAAGSGGAGERATAVLSPPAYGVDVIDRMGRHFGQDFSGVEIHAESPRAPALGALAFTQGESIHFAPGQYQPHTRRGQELLGHELAHVVQQRQGRVAPTATLGSGMALNDNPELEREAEQAGRLAAASRDAPAVQRMCDECSAEEERKVTRSPPRRSAARAPIQRARAVLKKGPKYNPRGTIDAPAALPARQEANFGFTAEFENKPGLQILASCGEIRQEILWDKKEDIAGHGVLDNTLLYTQNRWYEDRDAVGTRYGHRADGYTDGTAGVDAYYDADGVTANQATGVKYAGFDSPGDVNATLKGKWKFRLKAIDTCDGNKQLGTYDYVTAKWS